MRISDWSSDVCSSDLIDAGFGARLSVDAFDDDSAGQAVRTVGRGQRTGHDNRTGRYSSVGDFACCPVVYFGALGNENAHGQHGVLFDDHAFDDLGTGADEAVVFDDGWVGL